MHDVNTSLLVLPAVYAAMLKSDAALALSWASLMNGAFSAGGSLPHRRLRDTVVGGGGDSGGVAVATAADNSAVVSVQAAVGAAR